MNFELPLELKELGQLKRWVAWALNAEGKKVPYSPIHGGGASSTNAETWGTLESAYSLAMAKAKDNNLVFGKNCGVGFVLGEGYAGIDLDNAVSEKGELSAFASRVVECMNTYTELSPSGRGVHMLFKISESATLDGGKRGAKKEEIEIYCSARYLTVTGNVYGELKPLQPRENEMLKTYRECFISEQKNNANKGAQNISYSENKSDNEVLEAMFNSKNGAKIQALYNGDLSEYDGDDSRADLALTSHLVYWTKGNSAQVDRLFRQSRLMRPKWDEWHGRGTYRAMTIEKAMNNTDYDDDFDDDDFDFIPYRPENASGDIPSALDYIDFSFDSDIERTKQYKDRKTGFSNLDKNYVRLYPGLYVLGSVTGNGKTTFCGQLADYLASAGEEILYFSLEQTKFELISKSLARIMRQFYGKKITAIEIRGGNRRKEIKDAITTFRTFAGRLRIIECNFETDINEITDTVKNFIKEHDNKKPVVFVDYLQLVRNNRLKNKPTKDIVDENVRALKKLSAENDLVVFVISSFNRQNYLSVVDFESFKESGGIEYSADVVWGLQLAIMNADLFNSEKNLQDKRKAVHEAKNASPRKIELVGLKNRYGQSNTSYFFDYYPESDFFVSDDRSVDLVREEMNYRIEEIQKEQKIKEMKAQKNANV